MLTVDSFLTRWYDGFKNRRVKHELGIINIFICFEIVRPLWILFSLCFELFVLGGLRN